MDEVSVTQADKYAAASALGYRDWDDATDYRLSGAAERTRDDLAQAFARHREAHTAQLAKPLLTLVQLVREYLPSDGISKDEFIQRILEALDNDEMAKLVGELEGRK